MIFTIAWRNLIQAKRRTFFLTAALAMVTMMLVLLMSLSGGLTDTMIRSATTLSAGHVNVAGFYKASKSDAAPIITGTAELKKLVAENTPGLDYIIDRHRGWARVISDTSSLQAGLTGIDIDDEPHFFERVQLAPEADYVEGGANVIKGDLRNLVKPNSALIFAAQAKRLGVGVGDALTVTIETLSGARNTTEVTVVAVAKDVGMLSNWSVFMPKGTILDLYRLSPDTSGAVMVYLKDIEQAPQVMEHLTKVLNDKGYKTMEHEPNPFFMKFEKVAGEDWLGQKLDLTIWRDEVSFLTWVLKAVDSVSFFLILIAAATIVLGIMNSMYIAVRERTREIGTVRAIGMGKWSILAMFMVEAVFLGIGATGLGAALGALVANLIDVAKLRVPSEAVQAVLMSDTLHLLVTPNQIVGAIVTFTTITILSALWPAFRASRLQPVQAIQSTT